MGIMIKSFDICSFENTKNANNSEVYLLISGKFGDSEYYIIKAFRYMMALEGYVIDHYKVKFDQDRYDVFLGRLWK